MSKCGKEATGLLQTRLLTILRKVLVSPTQLALTESRQSHTLAIRGFPF